MNINPVVFNETNRIDTFRYTSVRSTNFTSFWVPKVYIRNGMSYSVIESLQNLEYIEVWPETKMVQLCRRLNVQVVCLFDLSQFPFDSSNCEILLQSG